MIKKKIIKVLLNDKNITRNTFFWNAFSAVMNSFQTMLLLLIITRKNNVNDAGIFVMAYAVGNLMINIGKYGVRQYQVTDVKEKYSLRNYVNARYVSMLFMLLASAGYLGVNILINDYSYKKSVVVLLICLVKGVEAFEDVYHGRMQQLGRLDVAGRILGIRLLIFIAGYGMLYVITENILLTTGINFIITLIISACLNSWVMPQFSQSKISNDKAKEEDTDVNSQRSTSGTKMILWECLPLCLCMCLNMYIANAPKYTIDSVVSDDVQTKFNIVFMPVFIIALLANFIFQPFLKKMGELWSDNNVSRLIKDIIKFSFIIIVTDGIITLVGSFIGNPILGTIYHVDLKNYDKELIIFMIAGGVIALQNLLIMVITTIRYQKYMIYGYIVTSMIMFLAGRKVMSQGNLVSLCIFFLGVLGFLTLYCIVLIIVALWKRNNFEK